MTNPFYPCMLLPPPPNLLDSSAFSEMTKVRNNIFIIVKSKGQLPTGHHGHVAHCMVMMGCPLVAELN